MRIRSRPEAGPKIDRTLAEKLAVGCRARLGSADDRHGGLLGPTACEAGGENWEPASDRCNISDVTPSGDMAECLNAGGYMMAMDTKEKCEMTPGQVWTFNGHCFDEHGHVENGEQVCEGHGFDEATCNSIGCCG